MLLLTVGVCCILSECFVAVAFLLYFDVGLVVVECGREIVSLVL